MGRQQTERPDTDVDEYFRLAESEEKDDLEAAIDDPSIFTGREGGAFGRIGLFGGHPATTDPTDFDFDEDARINPRGIVKTAYEAAAEISDDEEVMFPTVVRLRSRRRADMDCPFNAYEFPVYYEASAIRPDELMTAIREAFEEIENSRIDVRALEFETDDYSFGDRFRAVYPWAKRSSALSNSEDDDAVCDIPSPIMAHVRELWHVPRLPDYRQMFVYVHTYSSQYDRYNSVDDTFGQDDLLFGSTGRRQQAHILDPTSTEPEEEALNSARVQVDTSQVTYTLSVTVDSEEADSAIKGDDFPHVDSIEDYARLLGRQHYAENHGGERRRATVGVQSSKETEDGHIEFDLVITG